MLWPSARQASSVRPRQQREPHPPTWYHKDVVVDEGVDLHDLDIAHSLAAFSELDEPGRFLLNHHQPDEP